MPLSRDDVAHIASLVRLGMSEDEIETLRVELSDILEQFETLSAVDTTDVPPTAHPGGMRNIFDDDELPPAWTRKRSFPTLPCGGRLLPRQGRPGRVARRWSFIPSRPTRRRTCCAAARSPRSS